MNRKTINIIFLMLAVFKLAAQEPYKIDTIYPVHDLNPYLEVLVDSSLTLTLDSIINTDRELQFRPIDEINLELGNIYWGRVTLFAKQPLSDWQLHLENRIFEAGAWILGNSKVDFFALQNNEVIWQKKTGANYAKRERDVKERWNLNRVSVDLQAGDTTHILIKLQGNETYRLPYFNLTLRKSPFLDYYPMYNKFTFLTTFKAGVLFITFLYHFLLFLYLRQRIYFLFSLWLFITFTANILNVNVGPINEFILGEYPNLYLPLWSITSNSLWFVFWFFGRIFVGTAKKFPILDRFILGLVAVIFIEMIINLISSYIPGINIYPENSGLHFLFLAAFTFIGFILSIILITKNDRLARYFGIGAVFATAAPILGGLWVNGLIELSFDPFVWGIFLQVVAYSFGLAYRQQIEDKAFKKTQSDLLAAERRSMEVQRVKDLNDMKSKFFANISHEFRTPLTLIKGPLNRAPLDPRSEIVKLSKDSFELINRNTNRLEELVDQLLELSKLESGYTKIQLKKGDLIEFIKILSHDFKAIASRNDISLETKFRIDSLHTKFDHDKLQKIIQNLLSNAIKYSHASETVEFIIDYKNNKLVLEVNDRGPGIPSQEIDKVFDRFYRVEGSEKHGSGIGLALTKEMVHLLDGEINIESKIEKGTSIKVLLPIDQSDLAREVSNPDQVQGPEYDAIDLEEEKNEKPLVLIIEDNKDLTAFINDLLAEHYKIITAINGEVGIKRAISQVPNLIISDVMMPKKNGYEVCQALKSNSITSHIPVLLLTAKAGQENKIQGLKYGADAYMTKPFEAEELLLRAQNLINNRRIIWEKLKNIKSIDQGNMSLQTLDNQFLQSTLNIIENNLSNENFSVEELASELNFSRSQVHRKLKAITNQSANQLIRQFRLNRAREILKCQAMTISETAYEVGFSSLSYFTKMYKEQFGELPSETV